MFTTPTGELGLPHCPGIPDHTLVSMNPAVLTAVDTAAFWTASISLRSTGTSAL